MSGQFCYGCMKFGVLFVSLFYLITGLSVIGLSTYLLFEPGEEYLELTRNDEYLYYGKLFLLVSGCLMLLAGILGCCGGFKQSSACLSLFLAIVLIISLTELGSGVYCYINREDFEEYFRALMKNSVQTQYNKDEVITDAWNLVQKEMHCCGASGFRDYQMAKASTIDMTLSSISSSNTFSVPESCCKEGLKCEPSNLSFTGDSSDVSFIYSEGCSEKLIGWLNDKAHVIIATLLIVGSVQLLCLLFTCFLICAFRTRRQYKN